MMTDPKPMSETILPPFPLLELDAAPVRRRHVCERCGETHERATWICAACEDAYRIETAAAQAARSEESIPVAFRGCQFDSPELDKRAGYGRQSVVRKAGGPIVTLCGSAGAGKTSLAVAVLYDRLRAGETRCYFVDALSLSRARAEHPLGAGEAPIVKRAMTASTLVLDDVGTERQDLTGAVTDVIFKRHSQGRFTVITTGQTWEAIAERYGHGIARRMFETDRIQLGEIKPAAPKGDAGAGYSDHATRRAGE